MCDFRWGTNPGWGLSFAAGCCGAPFRQIETVCRGVDDPQLIEGPPGWLLNQLYRPPSAQSKEVGNLSGPPASQHQHECSDPNTDPCPRHVLRRARESLAGQLLMLQRQCFHCPPPIDWIGRHDATDDIYINLSMTPTIESLPYLQIHPKLRGNLKF